jgi:tetratricopeptide (TPR) repeat protein
VTPLEKCLSDTAKKTVSESTVKEMIYVQKDLDTAEAAAMSLVNQDRNWSVSYHELAEVYLLQEKHHSALAAYDSAIAAGMPRLSLSQFMRGSCLFHLGEMEEALEMFDHVLSIDEDNIAAGLNGWKISRKTNRNDQERYNQRIDAWQERGLLSREQVLSYDK